MGLMISEKKFIDSFIYKQLMKSVCKTTMMIFDGDGLLLWLVIVMFPAMRQHDAILLMLAGSEAEVAKVGLTTLQTTFYRELLDVIS